MPYALSQVRQLYIGLRDAPSLKGIRVLLGARHLPKSGSAPRVVLFPKGGPIVGRGIREGQNNAGVTVQGPGAIRDVERVLIAHLWAASGEGTDQHFDAMEDLQNRFFQALEYQAIGGYPNNAGAIPGLYWTANEESWDVSEDTAKQGEDLWIELSARVAINPAAQTTGQVLAVAFSTLTTALSASMGSSDTAASVVSTAGFPSTGGVLSIDAEQLQFTAIIGNQFVGLVRGVNSTTPSTHNSGATVNVS